MAQNLCELKIKGAHLCSILTYGIHNLINAQVTQAGGTPYKKVRDAPHLKDSRLTLGVHDKTLLFLSVKSSFRVHSKI